MIEVIEFNGKEFVDIKTAHSIIKNKLDFPEYYGENLNALWDCLTGWIDIPIEIVWNNYNESCLNLGEYANELKCVFEEAMDEIDGLIFKVN